MVRILNVGYVVGLKVRHKLGEAKEFDRYKFRFGTEEINAISRILPNK